MEGKLIEILKMKKNLYRPKFFSESTISIYFYV
jgi:hypothetical protein